MELRDFEDNFTKLLDSYSVHYNPASLTEAKWIMLRLSRRNPGQRETILKSYRTGLKVLLADSKLKQTALTNDVVETIADELYAKQGLKDYFDRLIYGTAADRACFLLTEDEKLFRISRSETPKPSGILSWKHALNL